MNALVSLPRSRQQRRTSWSLVCNAGPQSFQSSGGILLTPAKPITADNADHNGTKLPKIFSSSWLVFLNRSIALLIFFTESSSSNCALNSCWETRRTAESWTKRSALKRYWKCSDQRFRIDALSVKNTCLLALRKGLWTQWVGP